MLMLQTSFLSVFVDAVVGSSPIFRTGYTKKPQAPVSVTGDVTD